MRERIAPGRFSSPKKRPGPEATYYAAANYKLFTSACACAHVMLNYNYWGRSAQRPILITENSIEKSPFHDLVDPLQLAN